ncbi:hypothetical protein JYB88_09580 [Shewanella cyperi]|uniref:Uncharacterized protein n=1 Tax=Shewanella cyperi TaxID=2814292 RepID=A0A974XHN2_9GAMM|nr:hypothetical protein [Shewanella cyperi]QSX28555.1 hypothetical protein JYB88_09580 [Shewanella cyperi]
MVEANYRITAVFVMFTAVVSVLVVISSEFMESTPVSVRKHFVASVVRSVYIPEANKRIAPFYSHAIHFSGPEYGLRGVAGSNSPFDVDEKICIAELVRDNQIVNYLVAPDDKCS